MSTPDKEQASERRTWIEEFEAAAVRPLELRFFYAFIKTYKPVLDDASYRAFDTSGRVSPMVRDASPLVARLWPVARISHRMLARISHTPSWRGGGEWPGCEAHEGFATKE
ncbi:MAG TPA: hypothetical protein VNM92_00325 [Thermoanaerobaculia bacterium]|nr:hypothetical protein [Thermoanaerobaculia bacterium]